VGLRILWHSAHPFVPGGFSKASRELVKRIAKLGHEVYYYAYGRNEVYFVWEPEPGVKIPILPSGAHFLGDDAWQIHFDRRECDLMVSLCDIWGLTDIPRRCPFWVPYIPLDHTPPSQLILDRLALSTAVWVPSAWALREFEKVGVIASYIPHGVDTNVFRPLSEDERLEARKYFKIPEDSFVFLTVGLNVGFRKQFPRLFKAFRTFVDDIGYNENVYLYVHANEYAPAGQPGFHLKQLVRFFGLEGRVVLSDMYWWWVGFEETELARLYNACDAFVTASSGEGFCLPILEAEACGLPCIAPDFSAMSELVGDCGWLATVKDHEVIPINAFRALVDTENLANLMYKAYTSDIEREKYAKASLEKARSFDWDLIADLFVRPELDKLEYDIRRRGGIRIVRFDG